MMNQAEQIYVFLRKPFVTKTYNFSWQCVICSLEDVSTIKPGKVSLFNHAYNGLFMHECLWGALFLLCF